jgi:hypothetical protein
MFGVGLTGFGRRRTLSLKSEMNPPWLMPVALAIDLVDQWVASVGICSKVATIKAST